MKRKLTIWLVLGLCLACLLSVANAEGEKALVLPGKLKTIQAEAFAGDAAITKVVISNEVTRIDSGAFRNCMNLKEVYFDKNSELVIAENAFEGCGDILFYAYPGTPGEAYAQRHGYRYISRGASPKSIDILFDDKVMDESVKLEIKPGGSLQFAAKVYPEDVSQEVVWSVRAIPNDAATIDSDTGLLKTAKPGSAVITATSRVASDIQREYSVLMPIWPEWISLSGQQNVMSGSTIALTASVQPLNAANRNVVWSSEDTNIAIVNEFGVVTGVSGGTVKITARSEADKSVFATITIMVEEIKGLLVEDGVLTGYVGSETSLTIPPVYQGQKITAIGASAFEQSKLASISLPEGITRIEDRAFANSDDLSVVSFPKGLTTIGDSAFYCCFKLFRVSLPEGLTSIGNDAFNGCNLTTVSFPKGLATIGDYAFVYCDLTSANLQEGLTSIGAAAFRSCELTSVNLPEGLTSIGNYAFEDCNLTSVKLPKSLTSIGDYAFFKCDDLTSISFPEGLTSIGHNVLMGCKGLISVSLPKCLVSIEAGMFSGFESLNSVVIPEGITSIEAQAFKDCKALKSVTLPKGLTSIGAEAFYGCNGLTTVSFPKGLASIGEGAFRDCKALKSITLLEGLTSIEEMAFFGSGLTSVSLPEGLASIGGRAFCNCYSLTSVKIPQSLTSIEEMAFDGCEALTGIILPQGLTSIGDRAFDGCEALTSIKLPQSLTSIGYDAFCGCIGLSSVVIPGSISNISEGAFCSCKNLSNVEIQEGVKSIGCEAFGYCALVNVKLPNSLEDLHVLAFQGCESLHSITIPNYNTAINTVWDGRINWRDSTPRITTVYCKRGCTAERFYKDIENYRIEYI